MAKGPASTKIKIPHLVLASASGHGPMHAGECVISIIRCFAGCADLVESIQAEQERSLKTRSSWNFWRPRTPVQSNSQAGKAQALCNSIVDSANQLGRAIEQRHSDDKDFHPGRFKPGDLLAIRVDIQNNLKNPMQKTLDNGIRVTGSQLEEWKALLDKLVSSALQDIQPRDT